MSSLFLFLPPPPPPFRFPSLFIPLLLFLSLSHSHAYNTQVSYNKRWMVRELICKVSVPLFPHFSVFNFNFSLFTLFLFPTPTLPQQTQQYQQQWQQLIFLCFCLLNVAFMNWYILHPRVYSSNPLHPLGQCSCCSGINNLARTPAENVPYIQQFVSMVTSLEYTVKLSRKQR